MCFIYAFFVPQLFELSIFDLASVLVCLLSLSSPFHLEHWHPPSSVIVFHRRRRRRAESASSSSHHTKPLVYCFFWFLPDVPRPDLHLPHILFPNSQVALCSSLWLMNTCPCHTCGSLVFLILDILVWRLIIIISHPHTLPSLPSSQHTWSHLSCQHCLNETFFYKFHSQNSRASHVLHWTTLCCKGKICWQFKGVTVWIIGVVSDHWNNKTILSFFGSLPSTIFFRVCVSACVYLLCLVGEVCQVNCHRNI